MSVIISMKIDVKVAMNFRRTFRKKSGMINRRFGFWANGYHVSWLKFIDDEQTKYEERNIPENFPPGWWKGCRPEKDENEKSSLDLY
jgi:hypothetical protein